MLTALATRLPRARAGLRRWGPLLVAALLLAGPLSAGRAQAAPSAQANPITLTARAGFDGYYKDQRWLPLRVTVANDGPDLSGTLQIVTPRFNNTELVVTRAVELPTQSRREIYLYVPAEGYLSTLKVSLLNNQNKEIATATTRLAQTNGGDLVYGLMAGAPSAYEAVLGEVDPLSGQAYVARLELEDLPPIGYAWHGLDVLVLSDVDTGALTSDQRAALAGWVSAGGRLIVAGGPTWQKTAAGLADLLPLKPSGTLTLAGAPALASFASADAPQGPAIVATGALAPDAVVLAAEGDTPLIVTRRLGYGQVMYLALDPAFDPLRNWAGGEGLFRNLLTGTGQRPSWAGGLRNWYSARDAINALPGLDFPSVFQICGFLGFYLIAVGPINYLVLRRLKRRELAWVTIPALVAVFSLGAYLAGYQLRGGQASLHRLSVVQVWPDSQFARVDGVVGLFSPRRAQYDLSFAPGFLARPIPVDAFGGPGGSFTVEEADQTFIRNIRLEVGAVEPFVVQGQVSAPSFIGDLVLDLSQPTPTLNGTVTNTSGLTLIDAVVLGPGSVQRLGELAPGASVQVSLPLYDTRASAAPANEVLPALGSQPPLGAGLYYPPSNYDSTIDDILGTSYYYNDREQFRRYSLLSALIDSYAGSVRGSGVYLAGWTSESPLPVTVVGREFETLDRSLYLVALPPRLEVGGGQVVIPPGLMQWLALNPSPSSTSTPYDLYLYQGNVAELRFVPTPAVALSQIDAVTLHLTSYGLSGAATVEVWIWDFSENVWVPLPNLQWGDTRLPSPARFVGPSGEIQARIANNNQMQVSVERLDFTLTGQP
ncbi:MAG: hypothetical protein IT317_04300 [Anaerolineales bacterium]|nr:hypothetical protein [Anaerolineales bacterium]